MTPPHKLGPSPPRQSSVRVRLGSTRRLGQQSNESVGCTRELMGAHGPRVGRRPLFMPSLTMDWRFSSQSDRSVLSLGPSMSPPTRPDRDPSHQTLRPKVSSSFRHRVVGGTGTGVVHLDSRRGTNRKTSPSTTPVPEPRLGVPPSINESSFVVTNIDEVRGTQDGVTGPPRPSVLRKVGD